MEHREGSRGIYRPIKVLFDTPKYDRALRLCWNFDSYKSQIALMVELLKLQEKNLIPPEVTAEDMMDLLLEKSKNTGKDRIWYHNLVHFKDDVKDLMMLVWTVNTSNKMRDIEFEAKMLLKSPKDLPQDFQDPKVLNTAEDYAEILREKQQQTPKSKLLNPQEVVMEIVPRILQAFWVPPSRPLLNMPSQKLSTLSVGLTKATLDRVSGVLANMELKVTYSRAIRDDMVQSILTVIEQMCPRDVLENRIENFAPVLLSEIVNVTVGQICGMFQSQSPKVSPHLVPAAAELPATVKDDINLVVTEEQPTTSPDTNSAVEPPHHLTPPAETTKVQARENIPENSKLTRKLDSTEVPVFTASVIPPAEFVVNTAVQNDLNEGSRGIYRPIKVLFDTPKYDRALRLCWNFDSYKSQIALMVELLKLQEKNLIPPEVTAEDMMDLLLEKSKNTGKDRIWYHNLVHFKDDVKDLMMLVWTVNTSNKMRDTEFEAKMLLKSPEDLPQDFQDPKVLNTAEDYAEILREKQQQTPKSKLLNPQEVVMEIVPRILQAFWVPPSRPLLNMPSQKLSTLSVGLTKATLDRVSGVLANMELKVTYSRAIRDDMVQSILTVIEQMCPRDVLENRIENFAPVLLSEIVNVTVGQICGMFQSQSPKVSPHLVPAAAELPATVKDDINLVVSEEQPTTSPDTNSAVEPPHHLTPPAETTKVQARENIPENSKLTRKLDSTEVPVFTASVIPPAEFVVNTAVQNDLNEGSRGIYRPIKVLFDTPKYDRALRLCWNFDSYKSQIALMVELLKLQEKNLIPPEVTAEDMMDLLLEKSKNTGKDRIWYHNLVHFKDDVKDLMMLVWTVNTSNKMRDTEFEAKMLLKSPEDLPQDFQDPKVLNTAEDYAEILREKQQQTPKSKLLNPQEVVMEIVPRILQAFWVPPSRPLLNMPSQKLSTLSVGLTKATLDRVSGVLANMELKVTCSRAIRDDMVQSILTVIEQMCPRDVLENRIENFAPVLLSEIVNVTVGQICGMFQSQSPKVSPHLVPAAAELPATVKDDINLVVSEEQPTTSPDTNSAVEPPHHLTPPAETTKVQARENIPENSKLTRKLDSTEVPVFTASVIPPAEFVVNTAVQNDLNEGSRGIYRPIKVLFDTPKYDRALRLCWNFDSYKSQIALMVELLKLQEKNLIPPEVTAEDMMDLLLEKSKNTGKDRIWYHNLVHFKDDVKDLMMLVWTVNTSNKMRDIEFEAKMLLKSPKDLPQDFQDPKVLNTAEDYAEILREKQQQTPKSKLLNPQEVVMEIVPRILQAFWVPPSRPLLNMPSQKLSTLSVGLTKATLDRVSGVLANMELKVTYSRAIRDDMVLSILTVIEQMCPRDVLENRIENFAPVLLSEIVKVTVGQICGMFQSQSPKVSPHLVPAAAELPATVKDDINLVVTEEQPTTSPDTNSAMEPPHHLTPPAETTKVQARENAPENLKLTRKLDSTEVSVFPGSLTPPAELATVTAVQHDFTRKLTEVEQPTPSPETEPAVASPPSTQWKPPAENTYFTVPLNSESTNKKTSLEEEDFTLTNKPDSAAVLALTPPDDHVTTLQNDLTRNLIKMEQPTHSPETESAPSPPSAPWTLPTESLYITVIQKSDITNEKPILEEEGVTTSQSDVTRKLTKIKQPTPSPTPWTSPTENLYIAEDQNIDATNLKLCLEEKDLKLSRKQEPAVIPAQLTALSPPLEAVHEPSEVQMTKKNKVKKFFCWLFKPLCCCFVGSHIDSD